MKNKLEADDAKKKPGAPPFGAIAWEDLLGFMPKALILEALADKVEGDPEEKDVWDSVVRLATLRAATAAGSDTLLARFRREARYAALVFAAENLYVRRGFHGDEKNPLSAAANKQEELLRDLAMHARAERGGGEAFTEPMQTRATGNMI